MHLRNTGLIGLALAGALILSACSGQTGDTPQESATPTATATAEEAGNTNATLSVSESGWLTVGSDGAVQTTFFDAGGRYRDLRNGEPFAQGNWEQQPDGKVCFEPDSGRGACWETEMPDENGEALATNDEGKSITIKRITYVSAPDDEEDAGG